MVWNIPELGKALANLYHDRKEIARVASGAGLDPKFLDLDGKPITVWNEVLQEANLRKKIRAIVDFAHGEYPENEVLSFALGEPGRQIPPPVAGNSSLGPNLERLRDLFKADYDKKSLRELLLFRMNRVLANDVSEENDFHTLAGELLARALKEGWLLKLAQNARDGRPLKPAWVGAVKELEEVMTQVAPGGSEQASNDTLLDLEAALSALPPGALARLVSLGLGERPEDIAAAAREPLSGSVLIRWARERHRTGDLLAAVLTWGERSDLSRFIELDGLVST